MKTDLEITEKVVFDSNRAEVRDFVREIESLALHAGKPVHHFPTVLHWVQQCNEAERRFKTREENRDD